MPPRAIWSGSISFGLVNVPVKLQTATKSHDIRFNQLERATGARIRYKKVSESSGEEVAGDDIVKGYEISKGQYVVIEPDDLEALSPTATHTIDIEEFVPLDEIDPLYFDQPYYVIPDERATKAYRLLVEVMSDQRQVAIGRLIMRNKEHLVAIRPVDGVLCLETLRFDDEVIKPGEVTSDIPDTGAKPTAKEVEMALRLVESLKSDWEPARYRDEYRDQVMTLIDKKAAGEEIVAEPAAEQPAKVVDLMAALKASLEAKTAKTKKGAPEKPARAKAAIEKPRRTRRKAEAATKAKTTKTTSARGRKRTAGEKGEKKESRKATSGVKAIARTGSAKRSSQSKARKAKTA